MAQTKLFTTNRSQAVRLPKEMAFPPHVVEVAIVKQGAGRLILPAHALWDDFFASPGIDFPERLQPDMQSRDPL